MAKFSDITEKEYIKERYHYSTAKTCLHRAVISAIAVFLCKIDQIDHLLILHDVFFPVVSSCGLLTVHPIQCLVTTSIK